MTAAAKKDDAPKDSGKQEDFGQAEVRDAFEEAQDQGFFGVKVDPLPNSAHSLESGPDAPPVNDTPKEG